MDGACGLVLRQVPKVAFIRSDILSSCFRGRTYYYCICCTYELNSFLHPYSAFDFGCLQSCTSNSVCLFTLYPFRLSIY
jgi:hypothetical protein